MCPPQPPEHWDFWHAIPAQSLPTFQSFDPHRSATLFAHSAKAGCSFPSALSPPLCFLSHHLASRCFWLNTLPIPMCSAHSAIITYKNSLSLYILTQSISPPSSCCEPVMSSIKRLRSICERLSCWYLHCTSVFCGLTAVNLAHLL